MDAAVGMGQELIPYRAYTSVSARETDGVPTGMEVAGTCSNVRFCQFAAPHRALPSSGNSASGAGGAGRDSSVLGGGERE